ncbi:uncharacterized protein CXQ87_000628 [Candidozyma duobushaemuli]|uniref:DNA replication factor Cdt1 C-terminal domain-containing protein n=1 Tax=Candidozyma duobushaemuli TaxID=1231522 RepID=A0A2V1AJD6_9ASCO|nr:uncharacterized protein CXQ87_000628 [[Candida] duobushaemulonis]PVH17734.1 hypothetical protein CXQ87_000628 [[Candida] duobushaemulonis]
MSGFNDLLKKGEQALGGKDGKGPDLSNIQKDAQQAYDTYNKTDGSVTDKAKAAYSEYSSKSGGSEESSESKDISPTKVTKYKHIDGLKNDRSKFAFQEKISALETSKANGLSLLERIKLKERMNSKVDIGQRKKDDYDSYIRTKSPQIYDIIYELASVSSVNGPRASQSFTLSKVISIIKDSTVYATSEPEIQDVINDIEMKLGKERLQLIERNHNKVIRVYNLNREEDLQLLGKDN